MSSSAPNVTVAPGENAGKRRQVWITDQELRKKTFSEGVVGDALVRKYIELYRASHSGYADVVPRDIIRMNQR